MRKLLRVICFLVILTIGIVLLGDVVRPKRATEIAVENYHDEHSGLYELEKNTLDVLYIGSSHMFSSISPEDIFKNHGITGYVQASSCQKVWQSYYYLKETYYTQKPKVVVLDTFMALDGAPQSEAFNREAIDKMKLSPAKIEAIRTAVDYNPDEEEFMSYLFPVLRYHDRWEELKEEDYVWFVSEQDAPAKGFLARIGTVEATFNEAAYVEPAVTPTSMSENCREYLDKIKKLCEENGSELILTKLPTCLWSGASSAAIRQWSEENDVPFLDYNADEKLRNKVAIDWKTDSLDGGNHLNYAGAMKMTEVWGKYLATEFEFEDKRDNPDYQLWNEDYDYYKRCVANFELANTVDLAEYLRRLKNDGYAAMVSCNNIDVTTNEKTKELLAEFGMSKEFITQSATLNNLMVLENGTSIFSEVSDQEVVFEEDILGVKCNVSSKTQDEKRSFSCIIDKKNWAKNTDGLQFVVWDSVTEKVMDSCYVVVNAEGELVLGR